MKRCGGRNGTCIHGFLYTVRLNTDLIFKVKLISYRTENVGGYTGIFVYSAVRRRIAVLCRNFEEKRGEGVREEFREEVREEVVYTGIIVYILVSRYISRVYISFEKYMRILKNIG